eukprot:11187306-Lingulodinium_polyedra.AAC.1
MASSKRRVTASACHVGSKSGSRPWPPKGEAVCVRPTGDGMLLGLQGSVPRDQQATKDEHGKSAPRQDAC